MVPLRSGWRGKPMDRHDREQLAKRPMIEQRLEHGEIADVLIAERCFQLLHFVRHITQAAMHVHDLMGGLPVNRVDLRFRFEIEQTEIECLLRFLLDLLDVVQTLKTISAFQPLFHVEDVRYQFVVLFARFDLELRCSFSIELNASTTSTE
jgi:hypothetical protein